MDNRRTIGNLYLEIDQAPDGQSRARISERWPLDFKATHITVEDALELSQVLADWADQALRERSEQL